MRESNQEPVFFTCMSLKLWDEYAQYTMKTWERLEAHVVVYSENDERLAELVPDFVDVRPIGAVAKAYQGQLTQSIRAEAYQKGAYCYRRDIAKFAWPVFAWANALRDFTRSVWLDADVSVKVKPPMEFILPHDAQVSYLGRTHHPQECPYTESGLIGFSITDAALASIYGLRMENMLLTGEIYKHQQWHDCIVFDVVRKEMDALIRFASISRDERKDHVFDHTLSDWFHHYRGPARKQQAHLGDAGIKTNNW